MTKAALRMPNEIPSDLSSGTVKLRFSKIVSPNDHAELVPFYHFKIINPQDQIAGWINLRVGNTRHIKLCAGHIGYHILNQHRGNSYAYHACRAIAPFVRLHYKKIVLTTDPENTPSIQIIEKLGAEFINEIAVPTEDPAYTGGARRKRRYCWSL